MARCSAGGSWVPVEDKPCHIMYRRSWKISRSMQRMEDRTKVYGNNQKLTELIAPAVSALGYEMWGLERLSIGKEQVLRVYIDCAQGIRLSDCQRVSEQLDSVLDLHAPITGEYVLKVSSPSIDRPLFNLEQMARFAGHRVQLKTGVPIEGRRHFNGIIEKVERDQVQIGTEGRIYAIAAEAIEQACLQQSF